MAISSFLFHCFKRVMSSPSSPSSPPSPSPSPLVGDSCWPTARVDESVDFEGVDILFGYGSLVWKPPCAEEDFVEAFPGTIKGFKRRFWQESTDHRGTPQDPGYVCILFQSNHPAFQQEEIRGEKEEEEVCGMCYRLKDVEKILPELDIREKNGYTRTCVEVTPLDPSQPPLKAMVYYSAEGDNPSFKGIISDEVVAKKIATSIGPSGKNIDYLENLREWLVSNDQKDPHIENLFDFIQKNKE